MDEKTKKLIVERFSALPKRIQELILSQYYENTLLEISNQYQLSTEQISILEQETTLTIMGLTGLRDFEDELLEELKINKIKNSKIAHEVNEKIFSGIKDLLELMNTPVEKKSPIGEELDERFNQLPEKIKKIIIEINYHAKLYAIAEENKFTAPQMGTLEEVTTNVIVGAIHPDELSKKLKEKLNLPEEQIVKIINTINTEILKPIREEMEQVYSKPTTTYTINPEIKKNETHILNKAGIKIIRPEINTMELKERDKKMKPILEQKLSGLVKASIVKTDHSVENITSSTNTEKGNKKTYPPKTDPYRLDPEE